MSQPRVLILRAPGTNCDQETAFAFERAGGKSEVLHINRLLESPALFGRFQILCIPGGFSYGDDLGAGRILGNQIQHHLADALAAFKAEGKLILGICNGFQVLMKSSVLLPIDATHGPAATLASNDSGRYEDRWVRLAAEGAKCVFLSGIESMYLPVAHAEGKFVTRNPQVLEELQSAGQVVLRYVPQSGTSRGGTCGAAAAHAAAHSTALLDEPAVARTTARVPYPDNPNGAMADTAGVCDSTGRVLGLMPHPERHIDPTQHPRWTRGEAGPVGDGLQVFVNAIRYFS